jgi:hypothetical protein
VFLLPHSLHSSSSTSSMLFHAPRPPPPPPGLCLLHSMSLLVPNGVRLAKPRTASLMGVKRSLIFICISLATNGDGHLSCVLGIWVFPSVNSFGLLSQEVALCYGSVFWKGKLAVPHLWAHKCAGVQTHPHPGFIQEVQHGWHFSVITGWQ